jgi:ribosomal protein S17E
MLVYHQIQGKYIEGRIVGYLTTKYQSLKLIINECEVHHRI